MAIDDPTQGDDLNLDLNVTGEERWEASLRRAKLQAEGAAEAIDDAFEEGLKFSDKFAQATLNLEKRVESLTRQFATQSTKNFGKDLDFVNHNAREAVVRLSELQERLQLISRTAATTQLSKGGFAKLTSDIRDEIGFLERQLLLTKQLQTLQAQSRDPRSVAPVDLTSVDSRRMLALTASLSRLEDQFTKLGSRNIGKGFEEIQAKATANIQRIGQLRSQVSLLDKALIGETKRTVIDQITSDAKVAEIEVQRLKRELLEMQGVARRGIGDAGASGRGGLGGAGSILQGLGIPYLGAGLGAAGVIAGATIAFHKFAQGLEFIVERGTQVIQSNRRLSASASELGVTYGELSAKNERYAKTLGLSITQTSEFTAKVAQLVARTAQPNRIDQFAQGLADLAAARGFDAQELITVTNQIITGQDEAYKKLGVRNPQVLYAEFAQRTGQSVEALSQVQKQIIYQDEILKKSQLFSGAAQARLESIDGQTAKVKAQFNNLADAFALNALNSQAFFDLLNSANSALKLFGANIDEIKKKLSEGVASTKLAEEQGEGGFYSLLKKIGTVASIPGAAILTPALGLGQLTEKITGGDTFKKAGETGAKSFYETLSGTQDELFKDELLRRYNAFKLELATQKKVAEEEKQRLEELRQEEEVRRTGNIAEVAFDNIIKRQKHSIEAIRQAYDNLQKEIEKDVGKVYFNTTKIDEIEFKKAEAISNAAAERFRKILQDPKSNIDAYQRGLGLVRGDENLTEDTRENLTLQFEKQIETAVKKIESLKDDVRSFATGIAGRDNPFVKLFSDMETATDRAQKRFGEFGKDFVNMMAQMERAQLNVEIGQQRWLSQVKSLDFRQQAEALENLSYQQTNAFQRNLQFVNEAANFLNRDRTLSQQAELAKFYAEEFDPRRRFNEANIYKSGGFLESKFGPSGLDRLSRGFEESGVSFEQFVDTQIKINELKEDLLKFQQIDTSGLGILGREAIARAVDERIPSNEELFGRLNAYGDTREDARRLLQLRSQNTQTLAEANRERFQELVRNQQVAEQTRKFAQEKIDLLQKQQGLEQGFTAQQVLDITGQLGPGELTASLRSARLQALNIKAEEEKRKEIEATDRMKTIVDKLISIDNALNNKGLKIDTSTTPLLDVTIDNKAANATYTYRPTADDTANRR